MERRNRDLDTVRTLRSARIAAVNRASQGDLAGVLQADDPNSGFVYVVKLLDVHPRLGKVAGRRLLADIGVQPLARVADLTHEQCNRILAQVTPA